ncbi:Holliday junction resolvase [Candidatus Woesearchaeota archaeon]|nr:Holliday junction resolvase [Candidatus Woesearchaeota archaeon]
MPAKIKGTGAERELYHALWQKGFAVVRAAGSGSTSYPCPDLLVGNPLRKLAIECKVTKGVKQYLTGGEIQELQEFCKQFGAEPWIAVKFNKLSRQDGLGWYLFTLEDLEKTEGENFVVSIPLAKRRGLRVEEVVE